MAHQSVRVVNGSVGVGAPLPDVAPVVQAAGALVWRVKHGQLEVRLIHRPRYSDWSWPKGKVDPGELLPVTAAREVAEETGKAVALGIPLPGLQYLTPENAVKRVHYWAATRIKDTAPAVVARFPVRAVDPGEVDKAAWMTPAQASERLTRKSDQIPLDALVREHQQGRLATRSLIVVRHGRAVSRAAWQGGDPDRPLTPAGYGHSHAQVPVFAAFGAERVVTSPWRRCIDTVAPYADAAGLSVETSEEFSESGHAASGAAVAQSVSDMLTGAESTLICTHRPVLSTVFKVLRAHAKSSVLDVFPRRNPYLVPGEAFIAHIADVPGRGATIVGAERIKPRLS